MLRNKFSCFHVWLSENCIVHLKFKFNYKLKVNTVLVISYMGFLIRGIYVYKGQTFVSHSVWGFLHFGGVLPSSSIMRSLFSAAHAFYLIVELHLSFGTTVCPYLFS